jgi:radical SAM protein with 4Fe4S-binding SPASM domain
MAVHGGERLTLRPDNAFIEKRALPVLSAPEKRRLPLADETRPADARSRPVLAVWELTLICDQSCRHCGSRAGRRRENELRTEECLDLVRQMAELGVREVTLIGGEAYLHEGWTEVIAAIRAHGMMPTMTTGGRGMTRERAEAAGRAGLETAGVSVDGMERTHDELRGARGSYRSALAALASLSAASVKVSANTQINRLNMHELRDLLEVLIGAGIHSWQIALTVPMGRAADTPHVLLQPYDLLELFPILVELRGRCDEAQVRLWPGNNVGYFGPYEAKLHRDLPGGYAGSCGAGLGVLGIEADGTVKGCPSLPTQAWAGGNVREHSLRDIWERAPALRYTRDRTTSDLWGFCKDCYYASDCMAGCTWTASVLMGKPGNNPYCHHRALELARIGKRERLVQVEAAPGLPFDHGRFEIVVENL